jgi:hypothetical protein
MDYKLGKTYLGTHPKTNKKQEIKILKIYEKKYKNQTMYVVSIKEDGCNVIFNTVTSKKNIDLRNVKEAA